MAINSFVHLHVHSQYSILDASASIAALAKKASSLQMTALALTDHGNLFGAIEFYKQCKEYKIKPIIGCEIFIAPQSRFEKKKISGLPTSFHLTLLAKNNTGYHNLCKLSSLGYTEGFYYSPRIDFELLAQHAEGLICLSGCLNSPFAWEILNGSKESVQQLVEKYQALFKENFYFELQKHTTLSEELQLEGFFEEAWLYQQYQEYVQKQEKVNATLCELGKAHDIKVVATNNVHYIERDEWKAHEILLNIQSGEPCETRGNDGQSRTPNPKRATFATHELFFKSQDEMSALFSDIPEALQTTGEIAEKCQVEFDFSAKHYPVFIPEGMKEADDRKSVHVHQGSAQFRTCLEGTDAQQKSEANGLSSLCEDFCCADDPSNHVLNLLPPGEHVRKSAVEKFLWKLCEEGIPKRYTPENLARVAAKYPDRDPLNMVRERLEYEMSVIIPKDMCDYLLIVWDFINWAKRNGIPMGPGRGSGAGSIILYLIEVTDIEPLQFHLFFERFINPERISYPDIDVDMCMERRNEVINYTIQKYGKDNVAQIITFGSMKARMVVKDVGRVLNVPLAKVNTIAKLIPEDLNITLDKALEKDPELKALYQSDSDAQRIIDIGKNLEGSIRNIGIHAAGMIISGKPLLEHIPVCIAKDSDMLVTQFSMKPVEMVGMLKIDFLGLKTLTCVKMCVDAIREQKGITIDWINLPLNDTLAFSLLNQGKTQGIFQLESGGMQALAKDLHLDKFEEIIAVVSLYRPGPMDMIPSFINRKHGVEPIEYDHPWLEPILAETYGIMVYQEQVMQIASRLANYSLGEGDVLRRAMGKKDMKEMAKQREKFLTGAKSNGIDEATATTIFDKMEKFAEYGFNKSHAAAYGYLTYVTAYLKSHFPAQWLAALMTCDRDDVTKIAKFFHEAHMMHIAVLPPDVNESDIFFAARDMNVRFALSAIKGVGIGVVEAIQEARKKGGPFKSLHDFLKRIDTKRVGKKAVELLIDAGCFDFTGMSRDALKEGVETLYERVVKEKKDSASGILSLFGALQHEEEPLFVAKNPRPKEDLLFKEKALLGFFLTGHPLDAYKETLLRFGAIPLSRFHELATGTVFRTAFVIEEAEFRISSKSQKKFAILTISGDSNETYELPIWPELYEEKQSCLTENRLILAILTKEKREEEDTLSCRWLCDLKTLDERDIAESDRVYDKAKFQLQARQKAGPKKATPAKITSSGEQMQKKRFVVSVDIETLKASHILTLQSIFAKTPGDMPVDVQFSSGGQEIAHLAIELSIVLNDEVRKRIEEVPSVTGYRMYPP